MMRYELIDFDKLSESREILEAKTPPFMSYFIYLVLLLFFVGFIWSWYGEVDIVVKANGVVRPGENVSNIINMQTGKINSINYEDGDYVQKGKILYKLDTSSSFNKRSYLTGELSDLKNKLIGLKKLYSSILQNSRQNLVSLSYTEYLNRLKNYRMQLEQFKIIFEEKKEAYQREKQLGEKYTTKVRLKKLRNSYKKAKINMEKYQTEMLLKIKNEINDSKDRLFSINNQMQDVNIQSKHNIVRAPISGVVQELRSFNEGEYLPSGVKVLKIVPEGKNKLKVDITINNKNISKIRPSQNVKYKFLAYNYTDYGVINGKIKKISTDAFLNENQAFYRAEGSLNKTAIFNEKNEIIGQIKPGMLCEVSFIEKRKKILMVVLEKLKFWKDEPGDIIEN